MLRVIPIDEAPGPCVYVCRSVLLSITVWASQPLHRSSPNLVRRHHFSWLLEPSHSPFRVRPFRGLNRGPLKHILDKTEAQTDRCAHVTRTLYMYRLKTIEPNAHPNRWASKKSSARENSKLQCLTRDPGKSGCLASQWESSLGSIQLHLCVRAVQSRRSWLLQALESCARRKEYQ